MEKAMNYRARTATANRQRRKLAKQKAPLTRAGNWRIEVFFDGDCPICVREISMLKRLDRRCRIRFTNIAAEGFNAADYGLSQKAFMDEIRARSRDGEWYRGVEAFRQLYAAIGLTPFTRLSRLPGVSHALEAGYRLFAKNRLRLTGRCDAATKSCA